MARKGGGGGGRRKYRTRYLKACAKLELYLQYLLLSAEKQLCCTSDGLGKNSTCRETPLPQNIFFSLLFLVSSVKSVVVHQLSRGKLKAKRYFLHTRGIVFNVVVKKPACW